MSSLSSPQSTKVWPSHTMGQQGDRPRTEEEVILDGKSFLKLITISCCRNSEEMRNTSPRPDLGQGDPAVADSLPLLLLPFHLLQDSLLPMIPLSISSHSCSSLLPHLFRTNSFHHVICLASISLHLKVSWWATQLFNRLLIIPFHAAFHLCVSSLMFLLLAPT